MKMISVKVIIGCITFGALYTLIFERAKGNHFENKKAPRGQSERKKTN